MFHCSSYRVLSHVRRYVYESKKVTVYETLTSVLWPPYGIRQAIIFLPCGFFLLYGRPM